MSFWRGIGSAFNLFGSPVPRYYGRKSGWQEDREALQSDWGAVSKDIDTAIRRFEERHKQYTVVWIPNDFQEYFERVAANRGCSTSDVLLEALHEHLMLHKEEAKPKH